MVTCNSSHVIEAPGKAGVGSGLISVAVGWRNGVAGRCVVEVWPAEEQAVKMNNPLNKIATVFFIGCLGIQSNSNTYEQALGFTKRLGNQKSEWIFPLASSLKSTTRY